MFGSLTRMAILLLPLAHAAMPPCEFIGDVDAFQDKYLWIMIAGGFGAFLMAYGIGANDVANSLAQVVGAKTLSYKQAVVLAAFCETMGAIAMGAAVTTTVRKKIVSLDYFQYNPEVLMLGMCLALWSSGIWLMIASAYGMPVSTTHSIIGGLIGIGLVTSPHAVEWSSVGNVILSWIVSPLLSGIASTIFLRILRKFILRDLTNGHNKAVRFYPFLLFMCWVTIVFFLLFKNSQVQLKEYRKENPGEIVAIGFAAAIGVTCITYFATFKWVKAMVLNGREGLDTEEGLPNRKNLEQGKPKPEAGSETLEGQSGDIDGDNKSKDNGDAGQDGGQVILVLSEVQKVPSVESKSVFSLDRDIRSEGLKDQAAKAVHEDAEKFPAKTEEAFHLLQVVGAAFVSFAHGANDTANALGPFAAIISIYRDAEITKKVDVPIWMLACGGATLSLGLLTYGYKVMQTIGVQLTRITPSRGFCIEMASAWIIIIGSNLGLPLSTTHCVVGATVGVGWCESKNGRFRGVNLGLFSRIVVSWVVTLLFTSIISASLFSFFVGFYVPRVTDHSCGHLPTALQTFYTSTDPTYGYHPAYALNTLSGVRSGLSEVFESLDTDFDGTLSLDELIAGKVGTQEDLDLWVDEDEKTSLSLDSWYRWHCGAGEKFVILSSSTCEPLCATPTERATLECTWERVEEGPTTGGGEVAKYKSTRC